jgi:O-antigen/teichoic acid export membrane protein
MQILGNHGIQHNLLTLTGVAFNTVLLLVFLPWVFGYEQLGQLFFVLEVSLFLYPIVTLGMTGLPGVYLPKLLPLYKDDRGLWLPIAVLLGIPLLLVFFFLDYGSRVQGYSFGGFVFSTFQLTAILMAFLSFFQFFSLYAHFGSERMGNAFWVQNAKFSLPLWAFLFYLEWIDFDLFLLLWVFSYAIPLVFVFLLVYKKGLLKGNPLVLIKKGNFVHWMSKGSALYWWGSSAFVLFSRSDVVVLGLRGENQDLTIYVLFLTLVYFLHIPKSIVGAVTGSVISHALAQQDQEHLSSIYSKSVKGLWMVSFGMVGIFYFLGWDFLGLLPAGHNLQDYFGVFLLLLLGKLLSNASGLGEALIAKSPYEKVLIPFQFFIGLANLIFASYTIPKLGIWGAALSGGLSGLFYTTFLIVFLRYKMGLRPFSTDFYKLVVLGLVVFAIFAVTKHAGGMIQWGWGGSLVLALGFGGVYSYSIYKLGISMDFTYWVRKSKEKIIQIIKTGV